jgi:hypothetical protein
MVINQHGKVAPKLSYSRLSSINSGLVANGFEITEHHLPVGRSQEKVEAATYSFSRITKPVLHRKRFAIP